MADFHVDQFALLKTGIQTSSLELEAIVEEVNIWNATASVCISSIRSATMVTVSSKEQHTSGHSLATTVTTASQEESERDVHRW